MFNVVRFLMPDFGASFDIPSVFLECEDFSGELPRLPLNNTCHVWLELLHVHLKYSKERLDSWLLEVRQTKKSNFLFVIFVYLFIFLKDHPSAPNLNVVLAVYLVKYKSKDELPRPILSEPVIQNLSIVGFCCLLRCLMTIRVDYEILNGSFLARLSTLPCITEELLDWLLITVELCEGELCRRFGKPLALTVVKDLGPLAIKCKTPARIEQLCFLVGARKKKSFFLTFFCKASPYFATSGEFSFASCRRMVQWWDN